MAQSMEEEDDDDNDDDDDTADNGSVGIQHCSGVSVTRGGAHASPSHSALARLARTGESSDIDSDGVYGVCCGITENP